MSLVLLCLLVLYMVLFLVSGAKIETKIKTKIKTKISKNIMVVLGCAVDSIQQDRVDSAIDYANTVVGPKTWFLTGGVKNALKNELKNEQKKTETEAAKMSKTIDQKTVSQSDEFILDELATNTAENFVNLKKWAYANPDLEPTFVITTSAFHQERASKIFDGVFADYDADVIWNVSQGACADCWSNEKIHMKNVEVDVLRALFLM